MPHPKLAKKNRDVQFSWRNATQRDEEIKTSKSTNFMKIHQERPPSGTQRNTFGTPSEF